jgi:hypothetical protein
MRCVYEAEILKRANCLNCEAIRAVQKSWRLGADEFRRAGIDVV